MRLGELYDRVIMALDEDWDEPTFWKKYEIFTYMKDGINDIIESSNIVLNERTLPIVPRLDDGELVQGWFSIPNTIETRSIDIHAINEIFWKHNVSGEIRDEKLEIAMPYELSAENSNWRNEVCKPGERPTHAVLYGGDVTDFGDISPAMLNDGQVSRHAMPKIRLYPQPVLTPEIEESLGKYTQLFQDFNNSGEDIDLGIVFDDDDYGDMLDNLEDDEGNIIGDSSGQEPLTFIIKYEQEVIAEMAGVLPFIVYKPSFNLEYTDNDEWRTVDLSFLPEKEILNIVNYVEYRAYGKAGDTQDINKSRLSLSDYELNNMDSRSKKKAFQRTTLRRCKFFK